jgi:hypothetical protein
VQLQQRASRGHEAKLWQGIDDAFQVARPIGIFMNLVQAQKLPTAIREVHRNLVNRMLRYDEVVNRQIETPLRGCVIGVTVHKVLDQASGLANAPLPYNHRAIRTE